MAKKGGVAGAQVPMAIDHQRHIYQFTASLMITITIMTRQTVDLDTEPQHTLRVNSKELIASTNIPITIPVRSPSIYIRSTGNYFYLLRTVKFICPSRLRGKLSIYY